MICVEQNRSSEENLQPEQETPTSTEKTPSPSPEQADSDAAPASAPEEEEEKAPVFQVNFQEGAFDEFGELLPTQPVQPTGAEEAVKPKRKWGWL